MLDCTARKLLNYLKQDLVEEEGAEDTANPGVFLELLLHLVNDTVTIILGAWMSRGFSLRPDGLAVGQVHAAQLLPLPRCPTFAQG